MTKIFIPPALGDVIVVPWMKSTTEGMLFKDHLPPSFFETKANKVDVLEQAQAIVLPNNFIVLNDRACEYINHWLTQAQQYTIPLFLFSCGDYTDTLNFDSRAHVFRVSLYKNTATARDISIPTLVDDIGYAGITLREKKDIPVVSFCGKAGFGSRRETIGSWGWKIYYQIKSLINPFARAHIRGVFWRQWILQVCQGSKLISTYFVLRKTFSGAARTIELPPAQARKEFIDSMLMSDFVLAPKGDGNYSNRFLEALSMGRIPVLIDTDVVLPLENIIDYSKIIVRVPMDRIAETPRYIQEFYNALSPEEWIQTQRAARETFEKYVRQDSFWEYYFHVYFPYAKRY